MVLKLNNPLTNINMKKEHIEKLIQQRQDIIDKIDRLKGTSKYSETRKVYLESIISLDKLLADFTNKNLIKKK